MNKKVIIGLVAAVVAVAGIALFMFMKKGQSADLVFGVATQDEAEIAAYEDLMAAFTEETGITTEIKYYQDAAKELPADFAAGTSPNVFLMDAAEVDSFVKEGYVAPITTDAGQNAIDAQAANVQQFFERDGQMYGVPMDYAATAVYYNTEMLADMGMTEDDIPTTWEEVEPFLAEVSTKLPEGVVPVVTGNDANNILMWSAAFGGSMYDVETGDATLTDPAVVEAATYMADFSEKGYLALPATVGAESQSDAFLAGNAFMMINGSWNAANLTENGMAYGIAPIPTVDGKTVNKIHCAGWATSAQNDETEQANAEKFIEFATVTYNQTFIEGKKSLSANVETQANVAYPEEYDVFLEASNADIAPAYNFGPYGSSITNAYNNVFPSIMDGSQEVTAALESANEIANGEISAQK